MANEKISAMGSITNSGTLQAPVIDPNNPGVNSRTTLPGPQVAGLGISLDTITNPGTTTISNTGTIILPDATGTNDAQGITLTTGGVNGADGPAGGSFYLNLGLVTQAGTAQYAFASTFGIYSGDLTVTDPTGKGFTRGNYIVGGKVTNGAARGTAGSIIFGAVSVYGTSASSGGALYAHAGNAFGASGTNIAGHIVLHGGDANDGETAKAGNVELSPGIASGASSVNTNGVLLIHNIGTDDPLVLDAVLRKSDTGLLAQSSGGGATGYQSGLGITITSGTISNTGTLVQPPNYTAGANTALGILLVAGNTGVSGGPGYGGDFVAQAGRGNVDSGQLGVGGSFKFSGGDAQVSGAPQAYGGYVYFRGARVNSDGSGVAGPVYLHGGNLNTAGIAGSVGLAGGVGTDPAATGGSVAIAPGNGGAGNGVLVVSNIGTTDPHILDSKFQVSVAGVGYVGVYSKG